MPGSSVNVEAISLMGSLGMELVDGAWRWNKDPLTLGSSGRLPLPLPKDVQDMLANKAAKEAAAKIVAKVKEREDKQSELDKGIEPAGAFGPTYEEAGLLPPLVLPAGGLEEDPAKRIGDFGADWKSGLWPGIELIVRRNLRVAAFSVAWKDVLPLFQAQYAEYLVNPIVELTGHSGTSSSFETTALLISPRSVSGRVPMLDASDLTFTQKELCLARQLPTRFLEFHLEAAAAMLDRARQFQMERENKAALAASFAMETVQFLVEDQRQRTDIASGSTVAPIIGAMGEWSSSEREAKAMTSQSQSLDSMATSLQASPSDPATAAARLAYATAWMQTVLYGPDVATLANGMRQRADEVKDAAQAAAQISSVQQAMLLRGQAADFRTRAQGAAIKAASERERAAAAAHGSFQAIQRVNDMTRVTTSKLIMACMPGGALNYAQHEQRIRLEYLSTLRAGLLRLGASAEGLYSMLGYEVKMPNVVVRALPPDTIPPGFIEPDQSHDDARPEDVLLSASLWLRDATNWFLSRMRLERRWVRIVQVRQLISDNIAWAAALAAGKLTFDLSAGSLGAGSRPRLRGVALEVVPAPEMDSVVSSGYFAARVSLPEIAGATSPVQLDPREIGRVRRVNASLAPPGPELTDCILNANPLGSWTIELQPKAALEDVYFHLWLAE